MYQRTRRGRRPPPHMIIVHLRRVFFAIIALHHAHNGIIGEEGAAPWCANVLLHVAAQHHALRAANGVQLLRDGQAGVASHVAGNVKVCQQNHNPLCQSRLEQGRSQAHTPERWVGCLHHLQTQWRQSWEPLRTPRRRFRRHGPGWRGPARHGSRGGKLSQAAAPRLKSSSATLERACGSLVLPLTT